MTIVTFKTLKNLRKIEERRAKRPKKGGFPQGRMGQGRESMRDSQGRQGGSVPDSAIEKNGEFFRIFEKIEGKPVEVFPQRKNKKKLFYLKQ